MGRLKHQTATANRTLQHNGKLNTLVGGAVRRSYRYDKAGNLIQTADQRSGVLDYVYDKLGRIESAVNKQTGSSEKFAFDPAHNILSDKVSDGLKDTKGLPENLSDRHHTGRLKGRNIGKGNRLEAYNGTEYTYDALGNMIYRQLPNGESQLFQYDTENQLIRAEIKKPKGNTEIWEYAYDPFGRRLSKERKDKLAWISTAPKRTHFVWDGTRLLQEYSYKGSYTYIYTDQDSYEPLAQVFDNHKDRQQYLFYFHNNQIGTPHEMTDIHGNLLWYGSYSAWGSLVSEKRIYENVHQPFRLQNQYFDAETGLHYNYFRYYEADTGRFMNQDPIGLVGGDNLYLFAFNGQIWVDPLGLKCTRLVKEADGTTTLEIKNKFKPGSYESRQLQRFVRLWNQQIAAAGGSMTKRGTLTPVQQRLSDAWTRLMRRRFPGRFRGKVVGHTPDATMGGLVANGRATALSTQVNSYLGGVARGVPNGTVYHSVRLARW
ncbi:RHS repeat domain-containing protein [Neisseria sp. MVDL19-042950]|uniref:RHS repeat domain-containing protein n=1 Tax=Neisseria sp. MVDL19-042950 TaxID=3061169 RepID=UPI00265E61D5|nr:RHS repeat-associated core domain-containing protein [Neisseria sp. MVDL19-042950]MDO1511016.1 RHS repeat-associated core domain-containing protein [Neisseria sp. MVDL19-042950]